jgi:HK97 family phage major capsid protein/HK97 family phage prohead protease
MLRRAYSFLNVKALDGDQRIIAGVATTPTPDRDGDIVEPLGVSFKNPLPLLLYHNSQKPVGWVKFKKPTAEGIDFEAHLPTVDEPGVVRDRIEEAWQSLKHGLLGAVSIGFRSIEDSINKETGGFRFLKSEVMELSLVAIPAQPDARIHTIKALDIGLPAASGEALESSQPNTPRARGTGAVYLTRRELPTVKTYSEQIKGFEATLAAKVEERDAIQAKAADEGRTKDASEKEAFKTLGEEIESINEEIADLRVLEANNKKAAVAVSGETATAASTVRGGTSVIRVSKEAKPGIRFARFAMCVAASKGSRADALALAKEAYPDEIEIHNFIQKTAVGAATTANGQGPLLQYTDFMGDFVEYLRPAMILGQFGQNGIPGLRRVPFNVRVATQTVGGSGYWVGQGLPKPLTKGTFSTITLDFHKLATISVLTEEEVRFANPSAEAKVRDDLRDAIAARADIDFLDPANAGTSGVKPASITNAVIATAVSGTDADAVRVDFKNLMSAFITANITPSSAVLIMGAQIALNLSLMLNALGQREFPDITMTGGKLFGVPVIVSEHLTSLGSPSTGMIVLVNASDIYLADDGGVSVSASGEASLEMLDGTLLQDGTAGTGASLVSLWQNNLLGLKAEQYITWKKRRSAAAQYLSPVAYTPTT